MDRPTVPSTGPVAGAPEPRPAPLPAPPPAEPRQRWRLTYAREAVEADAVGRAAVDAWQAGLAASGLPIAGLDAGGPGRARIAFGAPLPAACAGEAELVDVWLLDRVPAWVVREAVSERLPPAHRLVGLESVWLGAPALAGQVTGAVWRIGLVGRAPDSLEPAIRRVLEAETLPRTRPKGGADRPYDLRPLIDSIALAPDDGEVAVLRITTRLDPALGAGRPEEVVAALADAAGTPLAITSIVRERLVVADPAPAPVAAARPGASPPRRPSRR